jgi:hypothetical protein
MLTVALAVFAVAMCAMALAQESTTQPAAIDFERARQLIQRQRSGQTLSAEERAYVQAARGARQQQRSGRNGRGSAPPATQPMVPLDQMTATDRYKGMDGGLYGGGSNQPPEAHQPAIDAALAALRPLDAQGRPSPDGRIVMISIGMSNTTQEFSRFKQIADSDPRKSSRVTIVDGAQGGMDAVEWASPKAATWEELSRRLVQAGVTPAQVQTAWVLQAVKQPARFGDWPGSGDELARQMTSLLQAAHQRFPNLRLAYLSSRIYAGYANGNLNPEPYAYESAFVVRALIQRQIDGNAALNADAAAGEVKSPLLLWGPYLWANGAEPRTSDGLTWLRQDLAGDGTHPSPTGRSKVANLLLEFLTHDGNAKWFVRE